LVEALMVVGLSVEETEVVEMKDLVEEWREELLDQAELLLEELLDQAE
jgi:hypothetical protein